MSFVFLLIVSESAITADIYLNKNWQEVCISLNDSFVGCFFFILCTSRLVLFFLYTRISQRIQLVNLTSSIDL